MQHNPSRGSFSKCGESYEKLLVAARAGNVNASNELLKSLFDIRLKIGNGISPTIVKLLDSWEFNHAFFEAYTNLCKNFRAENGCSVKTYFSALLKNAMIAEATSSAVFQRLNTLSLDEERRGSDGEIYTLGDMLAEEDRRSYSEVTDYMNLVDYIDTVECLEYELPKSEKAVIKMRIEGLTYEQIGDILSMSTSKARNVFMRFYDSALKNIYFSDVDRFKKSFESLAC